MNKRESLVRLHHLLVEIFHRRTDAERIVDQSEINPAFIQGAFTIILASLLLAAGEPPLAQAYVEASEEARLAIVAVYEWQRLATALLFDAFGFFLLGVVFWKSRSSSLKQSRA